MTSSLPRKRSPTELMPQVVVWNGDRALPNHRSNDTSLTKT
jgi:hypothetical protein